MNQQHLNWKCNALYTAVTDIKSAHFIHFFIKDNLPDKGENVPNLMELVY